MTSREAIEHIRYIRSCSDWDAEGYKALNMAVDALEKQIPKKNINGACPACHNIFLFKRNEIIGNVCKWCGQAIDWSGGDEDI